MNKTQFLEGFGYRIGSRDPRINTASEGKYMVCEDFAEGDYPLPTRDGSNGPWAIVGDDMDMLVNEAYEHALSISTENEF